LQYFASFEPFEIFEEFNGVPGTYIKSFLISDKINLNNWQATHEANISNLTSFIGRPGIHYINPENGKRDHTGATTKEKSLQIQELYRAASIIAVGSDIATRKHWQMSLMIDDEISAKIRSKEIQWISPSIWPKEDAVEQIQTTEGKTIDVVHDYEGLHYAFVDEPAFDDDAAISSFCDGTTKACQLELAKFNAAIDNVGPITEDRIKLPKKEKQEDNSSSQPVNTSHNDKITSKNQMASEEELRKELEEAKKSLKATQEELKKLQDDAKKSSEEDREENKDSSKSRKGTDEDSEKKESTATTDEDEEKKALKARIEVLEKTPVVEKIVSSQLSAGVITSDKVPETKSRLMKASIDELNTIHQVVKPFEAKLKQHSTSTGMPSAPYLGSVSSDSEDFSQYASFDASVDSMDFDELMEKGTQ
jgi:hypothetical protein